MKMKLFSFFLMIFVRLLVGPIKQRQRSWRGFRVRLPPYARLPPLPTREYRMRSTKARNALR